MWPRYASPLLLSALLLAGCAGAPLQESSQAPETGMPAPARTVPDIDVDKEYRTAVALMQAGDWRAAGARLDSVTAAAPQLASAWTNLGIARIKLGNLDGAHQALQQAIELDSTQAEAWNQLGMLYRRSSRLEEARFSYNEALRHDPGLANAHWNLAILHERYLNDPAQAVTHYEQYQQLTQSGDAQLQQWINSLREQLPAQTEQTAGVTK